MLAITLPHTQVPSETKLHTSHTNHTWQATLTCPYSLACHEIEMQSAKAKSDVRTSSDIRAPFTRTTKQDVNRRCLCYGYAVSSFSQIIWHRLIRLIRKQQTKKPWAITEPSDCPCLCDLQLCSIAEGTRSPVHAALSHEPEVSVF